MRDMRYTFKKGDRVKVVNPMVHNGIELLGQIGTIEENESMVPWVLFDEVHRPRSRDYSRSPIISGPVAIDQYSLELVEDEAKAKVDVYDTLAVDALHEATRQKMGDHDRMSQLIQEEKELADVKGHDYAAGGPRTGNFQRVGSILALYPDLKPSDPRVVCIMYLLKQLDSILWGLNTGIKKKVENVGERTRDISIYAKLYQMNEEEANA